MNWNRETLTYTIIALLICLFVCWGCIGPPLTNNPPITNPPVFGPEWLNSIIEIANAASLANLASTPLNPYVYPIGIGLTGLISVLEALRRKEKSGRKHAEQKLNGNGNNH